MAGFSAKKRVVVVLAGESLPAPVLAAWCASSDLIIAADGGVEALLRLGVSPAAVVGDMDSVQSPLPPSIETIVSQDPNLNLTDADKVLTYARSLGIQKVTLLNAEGGLPDHQLAVYSSAARSGLRCRIVFGRGFGYVITGGEACSVAARDRVSLLPLTRCSGVNLTGVEWPLRDQELDALGLISISNRAIGERVHVDLNSGAALLFVARPIDPDWGE